MPIRYKEDFFSVSFNSGYQALYNALEFLQILLKIPQYSNCCDYETNVNMKSATKFNHNGKEVFRRYTTFGISRFAIFMSYVFILIF